jgi:hypothetical protein
MLLGLQKLCTAMNKIAINNFPDTESQIYVFEHMSLSFWNTQTDSNMEFVQFHLTLFEGDEIFHFK